jgi:hypothetical protein
LLKAIERLRPQLSEFRGPGWRAGRNRACFAVGVRLGAFARAYVVAHEVAHHVQVLLGITGRVRAADQQDLAGTNGRSVRLELRAADRGSSRGNPARAIRSARRPITRHE